MLKTNFNHNPFRTSLYSEFNYGETMVSIYDLQLERQELKHKIEVIEEEIVRYRQRLPDEVYVLYEQMLVADKLKCHPLTSDVS